VLESSKYPHRCQLHYSRPILSLGHGDVVRVLLETFLLDAAGRVNSARAYVLMHCMRYRTAGMGKRVRGTS